jgi:NAD(P)-dependent dehydrogenase (short-subunit alcohol dehydrogenase family)
MLISDTGAFDFGHEFDAPLRALAGKRVLITGVSAASGIDIARSFAEAGARLILQCNDASPAVEALATLLAPVAAELSVHTVQLASADEIVAFARDTAAEFGGLDMVINLVPLDGQSPRADASLADIETSVSHVLLKACLISRVAANRMRLLMTDGVILTVATLSHGATATQRSLAQVVRSTLAAMTRREAEAWADQGIRFNAVAPDVLSLVTKPASGREADVAQLALYLATGNGTSLSGLTFAAQPLAVRDFRPTFRTGRTLWRKIHIRPPNLRQQNKHHPP